MDFRFNLSMFMIIKYLIYDKKSKGIINAHINKLIDKNIE